eukprot:scaffold117221_cov29-Tisochrysis_lutea.AAC.2
MRREDRVATGVATGGEVQHGVVAEAVRLLECALAGVALVAVRRVGVEARLSCFAACAAAGVAEGVPTALALDENVSASSFSSAVVNKC